MTPATFRAHLLVQRFGPEWDTLNVTQRGLVGEDFRQLLAGEYNDVEDSTMLDGTMENASIGSIEYRRRIGGGNLLAYARTLEAGAK